MPNATNITWHKVSVTKSERRNMNQHQSAVLWFTGLSGSGKSTIANAVDRKLFDMGIRSFVLDGDNIRHGLNANLGFSTHDRKENIRRIGEVSKLFVESGAFALTAFISPFHEDRNRVREALEPDEFIEIFVKCPIDECESRDPKGLYKKARNGEIAEFTGVSSPYDEPLSPEIIIESKNYSVEESVEIIIRYLKERKYI